MKTIILALSVLLSIPAISGTGYEVGAKVKDFKLKNIDGKMVSMADYDEAKGFIVIFTCNHCPYAKMYEDRIVALDKMFADKGFPVIAINPNDPEIKPEDSFENMKKRAKKKGFTFPYLVDETQDIAKAFGATKTPHVFIINKENSDLVLKYIGAIDDAPRDAANVTEKYVEDAVNAILEGKVMPRTETKAIGCSIKWSQS